MQNTLLIFAKPPRMGISKTRLARDVGLATAQRLNRLCHSRVMRAANSTQWSTTIYVAPDKDMNTNVGNLWPSKFSRATQRKGDLGTRLSRAFKASPNGSVVVVGTDCPDITQNDIKNAFLLLKKFDAVLGPAQDGGFWLFGASSRLRKKGLLFNPVRWSSKYTLSDMKASLPAQTRTKLIHSLIDLDDAFSLAHWKNSTQKKSSD